MQGDSNNVQQVTFHDNRPAYPTAQPWNHSLGVVNMTRDHQGFQGVNPDGVPFTSVEILAAAVQRGHARINPRGGVEFHPDAGENAGHEYWKAVRRERKEDFQGSLAAPEAVRRERSEGRA